MKRLLSFSYSRCAQHTRLKSSLLRARCKLD
jgi:hypothetical protein